MKDATGRVGWCRLRQVISGIAILGQGIFDDAVWTVPNTHPGREIRPVGTAFPVAWTGGGAICIPQKLQMFGLSSCTCSLQLRRIHSL